MSKLLLRPLLIFTGVHPSDSSLSREGVTNTASLLRQAFFTQRGLNIPEENGCVIENENFVSANDRIVEFISLLNAEKDIPLIYFCGHGWPDYREKSVVLSLSDTTSKNWRYCGIKHRTLLELLKQKNMRKYIIILDCCNSGFLCDMGERGIGSVLSLPKDDSLTGAAFIASTLRDDITIQSVIDEKYYLPFSYYFAKVLLGSYESQTNALSLQQIFDLVKEKLDERDDYPSQCVLQTRGDIAQSALFKIKVRTSYSSKPNKTFDFADYFSITELKVLLVKSAIEYPIKYDDFGVPLGLWMLKGHLSTSGLSVKIDIYDERLELKKCGDNEEERKNIKSHFQNIIEDYDVIGVSVSTAEVWPALEKFKIAKMAQKITICGGIFTSSNESYLLNTGLVDYVIPGVSTVPFTDLLARLIQEKKRGQLGLHVINEHGVASKDNQNQFDGVWVPTVLPAMRKSIWIDIIDQYGPYLEDSATHKKRMDVYTARGCNRNCTFCSVQKESRQIVLRKATDCVIEEIQYLESQGIEYFSFKDEDLLSDPDRMFDILNAVQKEGVLFKIRARYDEMLQNSISLETLHRLGVTEIQYGIESPDIHLQRTISKGFPRETNESDLVKFIRSHDEHGIKANCSFILGISGEDIEYYDELFEFIKRIYDDTSHPKIYVNFYTPHPINSQFPIQNYILATNNLNYFTHKFPVCYSQNHKYGIRKKMLETYDKIVEYTRSSLYNPPTEKIPDDLKDDFLSGRVKIAANDMPQFIQRNKL